MPLKTTEPPPRNAFLFDDLDEDGDDGWEEMPVVREDLDASGFDEEDRKKYHYVSAGNTKNAQNQTGNLIDFDYEGKEWRSKLESDVAESEYTRLQGNEDDSEAADELQLRTKYLFDEDKAMTPLAQMNTTKKLLTEAQRIAYVGICQLTIREMAAALYAGTDARGKVRREDKEFKETRKSLELWALRIMGRLYYHMELETQEQKMIESLAVHGVRTDDLVPSLMTTHTVKNPEYDPEEARLHDIEVREREEEEERKKQAYEDEDEATLAETPPPYSKGDDDGEPTTPMNAKPSANGTNTTSPKTPTNVAGAPPTQQTTAQVLPSTTTTSISGVSTTLNSYEREVTLDIRWTLLCDLFLVLTADSVYDARSRVLLERVAHKLGLGWIDVVRFEGRVTQALEIEEEVEKERLGEGKQGDILAERVKRGKRKRYMMLGLATLGGGLVIGLSAGLLAPVIGVGLAGAFTTVGITGTSGFLAGAGGAAVITTGGVLTGSGIAARGMVNRTQVVRTFDVLPLHNNKRVSCILTVPGFLNGALDDPRLPFSVLDPAVGDVFSVLWEPEMIRETGGALKILTGEVLSQIGQTVLSATVMTALMSALQWPIILTKLGYLIDNPWSNALDRAKAAGLVLADVLIQRHLGVRPITLIGYSLGARVIFYALLEMARQKAFGVVQDVILLGATLTASTTAWCQTRAVVSGRYVNGFARNDWVLNYLFRATSGGVGTVAGLRKVEGVPGIENVDVTDKIAGHMSYRTFMPLILDQLGFPVERDYFDDPVEPDFEEERIVVNPEDEKNQKKGWFGRKSSNKPRPSSISRPPSGFASPQKQGTTPANGRVSTDDGDDLPPREPSSAAHPIATESEEATKSQEELDKKIPKHAGFNFGAIKAALAEEKKAGKGNEDGLRMPAPQPILQQQQIEQREQQASMPSVSPPTNRSESTPPSVAVASTSLDSGDDEDDEERRDGGLTPAFSRSLSLGDALDTAPPRRHSSEGVASPDPSSSTPLQATPKQSRMELPPIASTFNSSASPFADPSPSTSSPEHKKDLPTWLPPPVNPFVASSTTSLSDNPFARNEAMTSPPYTTTANNGNSWSLPPLTSHTNDPYAAESNGLSFGGADGTLSFGGMDGSLQPKPKSSTDDDPWKMPPIGLTRKQSQGLSGANPWG